MRGLKILLVFLILVSTFSVALAQRPDAPPYGLRGTYPVGTREFIIDAESERPLKVTMWYPALNPDDLPEEIIYRESLATVDGRALLDATPDPSAAPYPLIIFSHGLGGLRYQSIFYTEQLASYGFVVMAADHPGSTIFDRLGDGETPEALIQNFGYRPLDVLRVLDFAETLNSELAGLIDTDNVAVTGHSFGGYTALSNGGARLDLPAIQVGCADQNVEVDRFCIPDLAQILTTTRGLAETPEDLFPATTDPRIKAMVLLAPLGGEQIFGGEGMAEVTIPTLIIVGSEDFLFEDAHAIYDSISSSQKALVTFENANHYIFIDECSDQLIAFGLYDACSDDVWDMNRAHDLINHFAMAFLLSTLKGDSDAAQALDPVQVDFPGIEYIASDN